MARMIPLILSIALTIYALADCLQTEDAKVKGIPRWGWILLIVLLPWIGPITWLVVGKDRSGGERDDRPRRSGPLAPDEDPEFLRRLDEDIRREKREQRRREQEERGDEGPASADGR